MVCVSSQLCAWRNAQSQLVPGSSQKMLDKARGLNADCVAFDLEDSVTPGRKAEARSNIRRFLEQPRVSGVKECAVRINAVGSSYAADDILEVVRFSCRPSQSQHLTRHRPTHPIWIQLLFQKSIQEQTSNGLLTSLTTIELMRVLRRPHLIVSRSLL